MQRDLVNNMDLKLAAVTIDADGVKATGAIDTAGLRSLIIGFSSNVAVGANLYALKLTECDTSGGTYTDIIDAKVLPGKDADAAIVPTVDGDLVQIGLVGTKRYVKIGATVSDFDTASILNIVYGGIAASKAV